MPALRVLLVEDHRELAETTGAFIESCGHTVDYAADGLGALHLALTEDYDVVVLDVMLPGPDGIAVCARLRREAKLATPVIMLTARDRLEDKLAGFDAGADDYLVKPFDLPELVARVEALARRRQGLAARFEVGDLVLDADTLQVTRAGRPVTLSRSAFTILNVLVREHPRVGVAPADRARAVGRRPARQRRAAEPPLQPAPGRGQAVRGADDPHRDRQRLLHPRPRRRRSGLSRPAAPHPWVIVFQLARFVSAPG